MFVGLAGALAAGDNGEPEVTQLALRGERRVIRERAGTYALDLLRRRLLERS